MKKLLIILSLFLIIPLLSGCDDMSTECEDSENQVVHLEDRVSELEAENQELQEKLDNINSAATSNSGGTYEEQQEALDEIDSESNN